MACSDRCTTAVAGSLVLFGVLVAGLVPAQADAKRTRIVVLSNRADLISGGDALVEIVLPPGADPSTVRVDVTSPRRAAVRDVTSAFAVRPDGRFYGLVTGLGEGKNLLRVHVPADAGARIEITNHPIGGPMFSGPQVQPWICQTETVNPPLGPPIDSQCNAPTAYRYQYRTTTGQFLPYDPNNPPSNIATTTTDQGVSVPYIVRIERGTRGTNNNDYHYPWRTYVTRHRLEAANGHAENHVFWTNPPASLSTLQVMDAWLAAIEADPGGDPLEAKVVRHRPADAVVACWIGGIKTTDRTTCDATYPYFRDTRVAAGDGPTSATMKCRLKPLARSDYGVTFTDAQWAALKRAFPRGVCDYSKPGLGQKAPEPWQTFADGRGGRPLAPAPRSKPGDGAD